MLNYDLKNDCLNRGNYICTSTIYIHVRNLLENTCYTINYRNVWQLVMVIVGLEWSGSTFHALANWRSFTYLFYL